MAEPLRESILGHPLFPLAYLLFLIALGVLALIGPLFWITVLFNIVLIYIACFFMISFFDTTVTARPILQKWPMVSILIPAHNRGDSLRTCLNKVLEMEYPGKKEIFVMNDASTDHTRKILAEFKGKGIHIIHNEKNKGKARTLNETIPKTKGQFIAVMDGDSFPEKDILLKTIPRFYEKENIGAVTTLVRVNNPDGILEQIQELEYFLSFGIHNTVLSAHDGIYVTPGPFTVYTKEAMQKVGGYDEENITEDMEITFHLHAAGYSVVLEPEARVYTDVPDTMYKLWRQRKRWSFGSWQTMFKYRADMFKPQKSFFTFFFPKRVLLEGSSVVFLFMILRMVLDMLGTFNEAFQSIAKIGFEVVSLPPWYLSSSATLYATLILLWLGLMVLGIHISRASYRKMLSPALVLFLAVYGIFIITVQAYSLLRVIIGRRQTWY
ncbi:MAG: glycosyltransferase family 2 protein [Candidatus Iainarchaeum archaeon]|uniref:Glycosyltransferase family 2 protein n=1 Tax=Candidatus Iainarchaeum sp. TaxID=3101447 RepID=A0A7T9I1J2_9ARCH|nr:MAG: glycosyltransferase family 2 protein [Candidatus Diapherotrites archaeon]